MSLFQEEKYKVTVTPEIKLIPEFSVIWTRDKDSHKRVAVQEFSYIYFITDYKSPYTIYSGEERLGVVKKDLGFDPDWIPDQAIINAVAKYEQLMETPSVKSLKAIKESLLTSTKVIKLMQQNIEDMMQAQSDPEDGDADLDILSALADNIDRLLNLSSKLPKAVSTIEELEEKVKKEQSNERRIKGGGGATHFED